MYISLYKIRTVKAKAAGFFWSLKATSSSQPGPGPSGCRQALHAVWSSRAAGGWMVAEATAVLRYFYQCMPKSEVACPKKDSITASNWGRFLAVLQIKSLLKLFADGGLCPTHPC